MRMPPKITFYPHELLRHEGYGSVNARKVVTSVIATMAVAGLAYAGIKFVTHRSGHAVPHTMSPEWQQATEEKIKQQKADPISSHKIGDPV